MNRALRNLVAGRPLCVVVEGLDGSGKSTLVSTLADQLGAEMLSTSAAVTADVRRAFDREHGTRGMTRQLFYAYMVSLTSDRAREFLRRGRSVVIDRYWSSTIAYPRAIEERRFSAPDVERHLLRPDVTVFLDVDQDIRHRRMTSRSAQLGEIDWLSLEREEALLAAFDEELRNGLAVGRLVRVSGLNPTEAIVAELANMLREIASTPSGGGQ